MRGITSAMILLSCVLSDAAAAERSPLIVLTSHDPWKSSELMEFGLYDDNMVLYSEATATRTATYSVQVDPSERDRILESIPLQYKNLKASYQLAEATDQVFFTFHVWTTQGRKSVRVTGDLTDSIQRLRAPEAVLRLFDELTSYRHPRAVIWKPERLLITLFPYEYSPAQPAPWPAAWPGIHSEGAEEWGGGYLVPAPFELWDQLWRFMERMAPRQAVLIDGRKWNVRMRVEYPGERSWRRSP